MKSFLRRVLPRPVIYLYNRIVSKRRIRKAVGSWFDVRWKEKAPEANTATWVKTYDESWRHWEEQDLAPRDIERLSGLVEPGWSVLDAGCGDGYLLQGLAARADRLTGADLSGAALVLAQQRLSNRALLVQSFLEDLPFEDKTFDVVVSAHTLEHVREFDRAVAELKRVARCRLAILVPRQEYRPYTEDYHLHFFENEQALLDRAMLPGATCTAYRNPPGDYKYQGDLLLLVADLNQTDRT